MKSSMNKIAFDRQARILFVIMVILGYILTFILNANRNARIPTSMELGWGIAIGVIYLLLGLYPQLLFDYLPLGWAEVLFFGIQCSLVFVIGLLLGTGGTWLIGLPLAGYAVEGLKARIRWVLYLGLILAIVLPIGFRDGSWLGALFNSATIGAGVFFVAVFAQLRLDEQHAREQTEKLMFELEEANQQLARYATQAEELAMTQERNRLAREIHDNLGHYLTVVNVQIEAAKAVMDTDADRAVDALNKAQELAQKGLTRVRESVATLRESPVSNRPLGDAIQALVEETQSSGIVTDFRVLGEPQILRNRIALALYRAAQEGLTNVRRHARASRVDILLVFEPNEVRLEVSDNGIGTANPGDGFGLLGIRERMHLLDGELEIRTSVGNGFSMTAKVPISDNNRVLTSKE